MLSFQKARNHLVVKLLQLSYWLKSYSSEKFRWLILYKNASSPSPYFLSRLFSWYYILRYDWWGADSTEHTVLPAGTLESWGCQGTPGIPAYLLQVCKDEGSEWWLFVSIDHMSSDEIIIFWYSLGLLNFCYGWKWEKKPMSVGIKGRD